MLPRSHNHELPRLPLALFYAKSFILSSTTSPKDNFLKYKGNPDDLSQDLDRAVDSGMVYSDRRAITTAGRLRMEAFDETSRHTIRTVAILAVARVPKCVTRRV